MSTSTSEEWALAPEVRDRHVRALIASATYPNLRCFRCGLRGECSAVAFVWRGTLGKDDPRLQGYVGHDHVEVCDECLDALKVLLVADNSSL